MGLRDVNQGWTTGFFYVPSLPRRMGSGWIVLAAGLLHKTYIDVNCISMSIESINLPCLYSRESVPAYFFPSMVLAIVSVSVVSNSGVLSFPYSFLAGYGYMRTSGR